MRGAIPMVSLDGGNAGGEPVRNYLDIPSFLHKVHALS
jgi:hypothetical protein